MSHYRPWSNGLDQEEQDQAEANRQTASLAGLAVALMLIIIGLGLVEILRATGALEDCLLAGRTDCGVTETISQNR